MVTAIKFITSFFKSEWDLKDYPLRFRNQLPDDSDFTAEFGDDLKLVPWVVDIVNWWQMSGMGDTKQEAYADLEKNFREYVETGEKLPRPGSRVPFEFVSTEEVDPYSEIAVDFFKNVLGADEDDEFWISDGSSLSDFEGVVQTVDESVAKIREYYGIDVSDLEDYKLADIFARIDARIR